MLLFGSDIFLSAGFGLFVVPAITTHDMPTRVTTIPIILPGLNVSPKMSHARREAIAGDRLRNNRPSRGPSVIYAWNKNKSPIASPTIPEIPNQNQRSILAFSGIGLPKTIQCVNPSKRTAMTSLIRLDITGPNFLPANVKNIDEIEKHIAVRRAAISPISGVMIAHELF
jgi:hypothetical protein